jgi:geranylgeranyl diphosphate synthase type I
MEGLDAEMERLRNKIAEEAERFLAEKRKEAEGVSPEVFEYVGMTTKHAHAGKMMREIGMILAYKAMGGKDEGAIARASTALTMLQAYLLIHDDIMDSAETRRKNLSAWAEFREFHKKNFRSGHQKFGESVAIVAGDLFEAWAVQILSSARFAPEASNKALKAYAEAVQMTGYGQYLDIYTGELPVTTEETVERIHKYKTAIYTVDLPLRLGFIFANAKEKDLEALWDFTLPLGIAFQMTDDIIDLYGDPEKLGKAIGGDIREGKKTIMLLYTLEHAELNELTFLKQAIANPNITPDDINYVKGIIKRAGGCDYARQKANAYFEEALNALKDIKMQPEGRGALSHIANRLVDRNF